MHRLIALSCHLVILVAAYRYSDSVSGFMLQGPMLSLFLDRYVFQLLPWKTAIVWRHQLLVRSTWFLGGAIVFYVMRLGTVPVWEAAYRGAMLSLIAFTVETISAPLHRIAAVSLRLAALGLFVLLIPVAAALHPLHTVPKRSPATLGLAFEDVRFRAVDGVQLAGWLVPHPDARGNVIFCHGHGRNRGHVAGLLSTFHDLGLNVLAFDFRGHGDSEGHTSTFGHREVNDLLAAEAFLRQRCPGQPLFLVGVSLGAAVSLQALPRLPEVRGVWSEGAFARLHGPVEHEFRWLPACLRMPLVEVYEQLGWLDSGMKVTEMNPIEAVSKTAVPIFFCHGRRDELVPISEGQALVAAHPRYCRHWWADNATHYDVRQRNAAEYRDRLSLFIEDRLSEPR
jgi:pimeloyl-ACP methyl ester carboxylesterase